MTLLGFTDHSGVFGVAIGDPVISPAQARQRDAQDSGRALTIDPPVRADRVGAQQLDQRLFRKPQQNAATEPPSTTIASFRLRRWNRSQSIKGRKPAKAR
jgi:hypothetical protein